MELEPQEKDVFFSKKLEDFFVAMHKVWDANYSCILFFKQLKGKKKRFLRSVLERKQEAVFWFHVVQVLDLFRVKPIKKISGFVSWRQLFWHVFFSLVKQEEKEEEEEEEELSSFLIDTHLLWDAVISRNIHSPGTFFLHHQIFSQTRKRTFEDTESFYMPRIWESISSHFHNKTFPQIINDWDSKKILQSVSHTSKQNPPMLTLLRTFRSRTRIKEESEEKKSALENSTKNSLSLPMAQKSSANIRKEKGNMSRMLSAGKKQTTNRHTLSDSVGRSGSSSGVLSLSSMFGNQSTPQNGSNEILTFLERVIGFSEKEKQYKNAFQCSDPECQGVQEYREPLELLVCTKCGLTTSTSEVGTEEIIVSSTRNSFSVSGSTVRVTGSSQENEFIWRQAFFFLRHLFFQEMVRQELPDPELGNVREALFFYLFSAPFNQFETFQIKFMSLNFQVDPSPELKLFFEEPIKSRDQILFLHNICFSFCPDWSLLEDHCRNLFDSEYYIFKLGTFSSQPLHPREEENPKYTYYHARHPEEDGSFSCQNIFRVNSFRIQPVGKKNGIRTGSADEVKGLDSQNQLNVSKSVGNSCQNISRIKNNPNEKTHFMKKLASILVLEDPKIPEDEFCELMSILKKTNVNCEKYKSNPFMLYKILQTSVFPNMKKSTECKKHPFGVLFLLLRERVIQLSKEHQTKIADLFNILSVETLKYPGYTERKNKLETDSSFYWIFLYMGMKEYARYFTFKSKNCSEKHAQAFKFAFEQAGLTVPMEEPSFCFL